MSKSQKNGKGGAKKYGRNKKAVDSATSLYARNKIQFDKYWKMKRGK